MGYTHHFTQRRPATAREWSNITRDFQVLCLSAPRLPPLRLGRHNTAPVRIDEEMIRFNGHEETGFETLTLKRQGEGLQFCKTDRRAYDVAVTALLIIAHRHAPDTWEIRSHGDREAWLEGLALVRQHVDAQADIPTSV